MAALFDDLDEDDVLEAIRDGVQSALRDAFRGIGPESVLEAIREGTRLAIDQVWPSEILGAIENGTREALSNG